MDWDVTHGIFPAAKMAQFNETLDGYRFHAETE
jgi:hypothetical protein